MTQFNDPAATTGIDWPELLGSLLLFTVHSVEEGVPTDYGPKDPVRCDVAVLDGDLKKTEYPDALVFPLVLIGALRPYVGGGLVVGRLGQGNAKPGQKPPWVLNPADDDEKALAAKFLEWKATQAPRPEPAIATTGGGSYDEEPF